MDTERTDRAEWLRGPPSRIHQRRIQAEINQRNAARVRRTLEKIRG